MVGRNRLALVACLTAIGTLVAACGSSASDTQSSKTSDSSAGSSWNKVVDQANSEGSVVLYSARQPANMTRLQQAFEKKYPKIQMRFTRDNSGNLLAKAEAEQKSGAPGADVLMVTDLTWYDQTAKAGQFLPLDGPAAKNVPTNSVFNNAWAYPSFDPWVIGINTKSKASKVTGYTELLKADEGGTIGLLDPSVSATATAVYLNMQQRLGNDFISKLAQSHKINLYPSTTPMAQALGSGEIDASVGAVPDSIQALTDAGAPAKYVIPDTGYSGFPYGVAALGWSKNPAAARVLTDFILSPAGQEAMCGDKGCVSVLPDTPGAFPLKGMDILDPRNFPADKVASLRSEFPQMIH